MLNLLTRVFGSRNDRLLRTYQRLVQEANGFESAIHALSDAQLAAKTPEFRERLKAGATLDELLPEAFAVVREAAQRMLVAGTAGTIITCLDMEMPPRARSFAGS